MLLLWPKLEGCRPTAGTDHDTLKFILKLTDFIGRLGYWCLRSSRIAFDLVQSAGKKPSSRWRLIATQATGTDQTPIEHEILILCIKASSAPPKKRSRKLCVCRSATYLTTNKELEYLKYTLLRLTRTLNKTNTLHPHRPSLMNRLKKFWIVAKRHEQLDYRDILSITTGNDFGASCPHWRGHTETSSHVSTTVLTISLAFSTKAGHPGKRGMYDSMARNYYWAHSVHDVDTVVNDCP